MGNAWATGVCVRPDGLEWTVLRRAKESWEIHSRGAAAFAPAGGAEEENAGTAVPTLPPPPTADPAHMDWDRWTAEVLKPHLKSMRGRISVVLPQDQALVRLETFPSGDADELYGMAGLQTDKLSPFPEEETATGVETLECAEAESLVALAIVRADAVERVGAPFLELGSLPDAVDVEPLAWWWGAKKLLGESPRGGRIVLRAEASGRIAMAVAHGARPIAFGALPPRPAGGPDAGEEWLEEAAEEASYALTALESAWGAEGSLKMTVVAPDGVDVSWAKPLAKALGASAPETVKAEDVPSVSEGAARRLAEPAEPLSMDLAPAAWREEDERRRGNRVLMVAATAFVALWLLALGVFFTVLNVRRARLAELEAKVEAVEKPAAEVRRLRAKVMDFAAYADRSHSALECLRAMSEALPAGVELNSFIYRKGASLTLRGESPDSERIYEFTRGLDESGLFDDVKSDGISMKQGGGNAGALYTFGITAALPGGGDDAEGGSQ